MSRIHGLPSTASVWPSEDRRKNVLRHCICVWCAVNTIKMLKCFGFSTKIYNFVDDTTILRKIYSERNHIKSFVVGGVDVVSQLTHANIGGSCARAYGRTTGKGQLPQNKLFCLENVRCTVGHIKFSDAC